MCDLRQKLAGGSHDEEKRAGAGRGVVDVAGDEGGDVCELVLAELQARRVRLRKLLHLLEVEVERLQATSAPVRSRAKCGS